MRLFFPLHPYVWALAASALLSVFLAARAWLGTRREIARRLALFELGVFAWCLFKIVLWYVDLPEDRSLAFRLQFLGVGLVPGAGYAFARALERRPLRGLAALAAYLPGIAGFLLISTNELHSLMWAERGLSFEPYGPSPAAAYWIYLVLIYAESAASIVILRRLAARSAGLFKRWMRLVAVLFSLPFGTNLAYHLFMPAFGPFDPTPLAFSLSGLAFSLALSQFNLLDEIPYAKEAVLEALDSPLVVTDAEGFVVGGNAQAQALVAEVEIERPRFAELFPGLAGLGKDGSPLPWSRGEVDYLVSCHPVTRGQRSWRGLIYLFRDVSAMARAGREREEALARADAANAAKSSLLALVSHDIRNPLNGIIGLADLNLRSELPQGLREDLEVIRSSGNRILGLVNDLLDLSKIEAGKMELESADFDLHEAVSSILRSFRGAAREKGILLDAVLAEGTPRFVRGDSLRFGQVLMNLVSNAIKFTDSGAVLVELAPLEEPPPEGEGRSLGIRCAVRDTGIGMAADKLPRLFRDFSQADASVSRRYGGTGLGLSICKKLVALFGGWISVDSREGEGSAFVFTARFEPGTAGAAAAAPESLAEPLGAYAYPLDVLVVDDEPVNAAVARRYAERSCRSVSCASSGSEAIALAAARDFDLVLLDLGLPDMDGLEAARRLRSDGRGAARLAAMTGRADPDLRAACAAVGMIDCLAKPVDPAALERLFERVAAETAGLGPRAASSLSRGAATGAEAAGALAPAAGKAPEGEQLVDEAALLERLEGDRPFMRELLAIFVDESPGRRGAFEAAAAAGDAAALMRAAHGLKGCALSLCAAPLAGLAGRVEAASAAARRVASFPPELAESASSLLGLLERSAAAAQAILDRD